MPMLYGLGLGLVFFVMLSYRLEYDFGWHVAAGDYIRAHGLPLRDVFTYTAPNFAWVNHEWLHDVVLSWLMGVGGYGLVAVVFAVGWAGAVMLAARRQVFVILLLAAEAVLPFSAARPALWGFLGFALTQRVLEAPRRWQWVVLPAVAVLWANVHGSFPLLLLLIGAAWWQRRDRWTGLLLAVCAGLTLLNPYGWRVYEEIVRTLLDPGLGRYVQEWRAFDLPVLAVVFAVAYMALWWEFEAKKRLVSWPFGLLGAAVVSARHLPFFVAASVRGLEDYALRLDQRIRRGQAKRSLAMWIIFCGVAGGVAQNTWFAGHLLGHDPAYQMPQGSAVYLAAHPCAGRVFSDYDFGGYLLWKVPGMQTYVDGRMPSWRDAHGARYLDRYLRVIRDDQYRDAEFARYRVGCVVVARDGARASHGLGVELQAAGWQVRAADAVSVVLVRPGGQR